MTVLASVVVPAYNEEKRIRNCLNTLQEWFMEVIVVCDGMDKTAQIVRSKFPNVKLVESSVRLGKGKAFLAGAEQASNGYVFLVDADVPVPQKYCILFLEQLFLGADAVIGSRYMACSRIVGKLPLARRILSYCYRELCRMMFNNCGIRDFQCGFKAFKKTKLLLVASEMVTCGFCFDTELILRFLRHGFSVVEYPVTWSHGEGSKIGFGSSFKMFKELIEIYVVLN